MLLGFWGIRVNFVAISKWPIWLRLWKSWHDDVIKWKHFPRNWPFVRGIHRSPVNSPHKGQWRRALMFSLICVWINNWVNNGEAGDFETLSCPLWRHRNGQVIDTPLTCVHCNCQSQKDQYEFCPVRFYITILQDVIRLKSKLRNECQINVHIQRFWTISHQYLSRQLKHNSLVMALIVNKVLYKCVDIGIH